MKQVLLLCAISLLAAGVAMGQVIAPVNLEAELMQGGEVHLNWNPPPDGLVEDFEDGVADDFDVYPSPDNWYVDGGYFKTTAGATGWQCAWYTGMEFTEFTLESTFEHHGTSGNSRGLEFRADGPRDDDYSGYNFYITHNSDVGRYSVYNFINGDYGDGISWTNSPDIVQDGTNTVRIVGSGNSFDIYINDVYQETYVNSDHPSGMMGFIASSSVEVWYDDITCTPSADMITTDRVLDRPRANVRVGEDGTPGMPSPMADRPERPQPAGNQLDEFLHYAVYVNDTAIGTTTDTTFVHQLPGLGTYDYNVTAVYDEGESSYSNTATVDYAPAELDLIPTMTEVPESGGNVIYDLDFTYNLAAPFNGVNYWTMVLLPNGQEFGPTGQWTFNLTPYMDAFVPGMMQSVPALAPGGEYTFTGYVGFYPNGAVEDSFVFTKAGVVADGFVYEAGDWAGHDAGLSTAGNGGAVVETPTEFALHKAFPNPFNPTATVSVSLPQAAELTVGVYNVMGRQVAELASGSFEAGQHSFVVDGNSLASGVYFIQANVPGQLNAVQKITLMK